jgi:hypothetical protein
MQSVHLIPIPLFLIRPNVPLPLQLLQIMMNILFKLTHTLRRERMRHCLPLPRMFRAVPRVEQPAPDAHKRVVVLALEEPVAVPVDMRDRICVRNANVVRLDAHQLAVLRVCGVHCEVPLALPALREQPEVGPRGGEGRGDVADLPVSDVWEEVVEDGEEEERVRREEVACQRHAE